jgi:arginyl-tRNA synthetase
MESVRDSLSNWIRVLFESALAGTDIDLAGIDLAGIGVTPAAQPEFGDYQCNDALPLAKKLGRSPRELAQRVLDAGPCHAALDACVVAGPGFINMTLNTDWLARHVQAMSEDARLGLPCPGLGRTVVLDYSSPNVAKPMHIGHIRSTVIGHALNRLLRSLGYRVVADNHLGDWGTQFGIILAGYRAFLDAAALERNPVEELERIYVKSYERSRQDEDWLNLCRRELVKLQAGDPENLALWRTFVDLSLREFDRIYARLGVSFDLTRGESHYHDRLPQTVATLTEKGLARESEGALVVFLEEEKLPPCIVRKSDGGFNYAATDIATALTRLEEFRPERIVYVTDERQRLHFRQVFAIVGKLAAAPAVLEHVWFGLMRLPEGTFSTRQGNVIKLEALLDEAERRALEVVRQSSPDMPEERCREVARAVGIGAVKYADLSQNPQTTVTFSWEKALALDGNSGPYLQYACARIYSVLDKYREKFADGDWRTQPIVLNEPVERAIALVLSRYPEAVTRAAELSRPSVLADYLYELARTYSSFYQNVPFLKAEPGRRESRLRVSAMVARTLREGLEILGIETPERI